MSAFDDFMISEAVNSNKEMQKLRAENATLRAELERLRSDKKVLQALIEDYQKAVDGSGHHYLIAPENVKARFDELTATVARLTGERDALVDEIADRNGIITGLADVIAGRVRSLDEIKAGLAKGVSGSDGKCGTMIGAAGGESQSNRNPQEEKDTQAELGCDASGGRTYRGTDALVRDPASTAEGSDSDLLTLRRALTQAQQALREIFLLITEGILVRNIAEDVKTGEYFKNAVRVIMALKHAEAALPSDTQGAQ